MRIDLNTPVTLDTLSDAAAAFLRWWTEQLQELLPSVVKTFLENSVERWTVRIVDQHWQLRSDTREAECIELDMAAPASAVQTLIERLEPRVRAKRLNVLIPSSDILTRRIRIPKSAGTHMRAVTKLQLDRLSPFAGETVHFDCYKTGAIGPDDLEIEIGIVQKATLSRYEERLSSIGLTPRRFAVADCNLSFRPVRRVWTLHERHQVLLAGAAAATWTVALLLAPTLRDAEVQSLSAELTDLRTPALDAAAAHTELERLARPLVAATHLVAQPNALDVLELLTNSIPVDVQVTNLLVEGRAVRLIGLAKDPHAVVAALRRAGRLRSVHLVSSSPHGSAEQIFELAAILTAERSR